MVKVEAGSLKNHSAIGSGIDVNNHGRRLREAGGRSPKVWDGGRHMLVYLPQYLGNALYILYILWSASEGVCHCISVFQAKYVPNDEITFKKDHQEWIWVGGKI